MWISAIVGGVLGVALSILFGIYSKSTADSYVRSLFGVRNIILDCYGQLCKTTADFDNVINRICDLKIKDNYAEDYGFLEENHLYTRGRLLNTINDVREIELFADVSEDIAHADENVQPRLTYNQILWLLKDFMRRVNEDEDDD